MTPQEKIKGYYSQELLDGVKPIDAETAEFLWNMMTTGTGEPTMKGLKRIVRKHNIPLTRPQRLIDADELLNRIWEKSKRSKNYDVINGLCGATAIIYDMLIESGQESVNE